MKLHDTILDDLKAQKAANAWNEQIEVVIITGQTSDKELLFLKDLIAVLIFVINLLSYKLPHEQMSTPKLFYTAIK